MIEELHKHANLIDGPAWLGKIPSTWQLVRAKAVLRERTQKNRPNEPLLAATQTIGVVRKDRFEGRTVLPMGALELLKFVKVGDFVISLRSFQGGIEQARDQGIISPAYTVLRSVEPGHNAYLGRLFKSKPFVENLGTYVTGIRQGQNIDYERLSRSRIPLPPPCEQAAIVKFLGHADRKIRRYIRAKQKLIALLEEQKQAIIHRAVTRGLNPDVPLKPSGVPWLGDIPAHWDVRRLKWVTRLQRGFDLPASNRHPGPYPVVSSGGIIGHHSEARTKGPGVALGRYGSTDAVFFVSSDFWPHNTALFVTDFQSNDRRWCYYLLRSIAKGEHASKSAVPGVDRKDLYDVQVAVPPPSEQMALALKIEELTAKSDTSIRALDLESAALREFRTRLIADVVTGKVDVREAAAALPHLEPEEEPDDDLTVDDDFESSTEDDDGAEVNE